MVGDSETDIAAACSAGVLSIGVASGISSMARLAAGGATWVVPSLTDLYDTLFEHLQGEDKCCSQHFAACAD
jgi:phosphoglycolate phosphatase-like HAD superfamily hydrolase